MEKDKLYSILIAIFAILFLVGIIIVLKANSWPLGDFESCNIAGSLIALTSGVYLGVIGYLKIK